MKKIIMLLSVLVTVIAFTACGSKQELVGMDKIEALRSAAEGYESACYIIRNTDSGEVEQTFSFIYDSDNTQIYCCKGFDANGYYAEYSNGKELFRERGGVGSVIPSSDKGYVSYTRKKPHPYSTGQLFFYINSYVAYAEETTDDDGNTLYIYQYDTERMNKKMNTALTGFSTSYAFDSEGKFVCFRQSNSDKDGSYSYEITTEDVNSITSIENPIKISGQSSGS